MPEQFSFLSVRWPKARTPKRAEVLKMLETLIPWGELEGKLRPHYQADARRTGRKGYSLRMLTRCYVVAMLWQLTDDGLENLILDSLSVARFVGTDPWEPRPPSASSFRNFRHLVRNTIGSGEMMLAVTLALLGKGIQFRQGGITEPVFRRLPDRQSKRPHPPP